MSIETVIRMKTLRKLMFCTVGLWCLVGTALWMYSDFRNNEGIDYERRQQFYTFQTRQSTDNAASQS